MSSKVKFANVLNDLLVATRAKILSWEETADENVFRTTFRQGGINVGTRSRQSVFVGQEPREYFATLHNNSDALVEELSEQDFGTEDAGARMLQDLYQAARYSALKPDDILQGIETEVRNKMHKGS